MGYAVVAGALLLGLRGRHWERIRLLHIVVSLLATIGGLLIVIAATTPYQVRTGLIVGYVVIVGLQMFPRATYFTLEAERAKDRHQKAVAENFFINLAIGLPLIMYSVVKIVSLGGQ